MLRLTDRRAALAAGPFRGPLPQLVGLFVVVLEVAVFCGWDIDTFESSLETPCAERCIPSFTKAASSQDTSLYVKFKSLLTNVAFFSSHVSRINWLTFSRRSLFLLLVVGKTLQT